MAQNRTPYWLLIPLLVITAWTGIRGLTFDAIWYDEWRTLFYVGEASANPTLLNTFERVITESDALNPPAYYALLFVWTRFAGTDPAAGRYLSVLLGILTVAWMYRTGRDSASQQTGLVAAAVIGTCTLVAIYMHEMRTYILAALLVTIHLWAYQRCLTPSSLAWQRIALLSLTTTAMLYTHYTAGLMAGGTALYHLLFVRKRWQVLVAYIAAAVMFLPWLSVVFNSPALEGLSNRQSFTLTTVEILERVVNHLGNEYVWLPLLPLLLGLRRGRLLFVTFLIAGSTAIIILNLFVGFVLSARYLLVLFPALALVIADGVRGWRWGAVLISVAWITSGLLTGWNLNYAHQVVNSPRWHLAWDELSEQLDPLWRTGDQLIVQLPGGINDWTHVDLVAYYLPDHDVTLIETFSRTTDEAIREGLAPVIADPSRVWLASFPSTYRPYHRQSTRDYLAAQLSDRGVVYESERLRLQLYRRE